MSSRSKIEVKSGQALAGAALFLLGAGVIVAGETGHLVPDQTNQLHRPFDLPVQTDDSDRGIRVSPTVQNLTDRVIVNGAGLIAGGVGATLIVTAGRRRYS